jgi:hypothetical protein
VTLPDVVLWWPWVRAEWVRPASALAVAGRAKSRRGHERPQPLGQVTRVSSERHRTVSRWLRQVRRGHPANPPMRCTDGCPGLAWP